MELYPEKIDHDQEQTKVFGELESNGKVIREECTATCINYQLLARDLVIERRKSVANINVFALLDEQLQRESGAKSVAFRNGEAFLLVNTTDKTILKKLIAERLNDELEALKRVGHTIVSDNDKKRVGEALDEWQKVERNPINDQSKQYPYTLAQSIIIKKTEEEKEEIATKIQEFVKGKGWKGRGIAVVVWALIRADIISGVLDFKQAQAAFGNIGQVSGYNRQMSGKEKEYTQHKCFSDIRFESLVKTRIQEIRQVLDM